MAQNSSSVRPPESAVGGAVPGNTLGTESDADQWRAIESGAAGTTSAGGFNANVLIQNPVLTAGANAGTIGRTVSSGMRWLEVRNGPLQKYGSYGLGAIIVVLVLFFAIRGRVRIEHGAAGRTIERFKLIERIGHWLTAVSFVLLGLTGLWLLYGKTILIPYIGHEAYASIAYVGKHIHHYFGFAFMVGLVLIFVMWVRHNIPNMIDVKWAAKGGGVLVKGVHPPAEKFNGGQKVIFWATILGGVSLSLSGLALMFPGELPAMFAKTFALINMLGFSLPTELSPVQELQLSQLWHSIVALIMIVIIIAHIYIGTIGMEGAFDAMGTGDVDVNWAKEHHSLWVEEVERKQARKMPAE
ncbi:formate dehydrogenase subunit gamma [Hwanghaeella grinnelliae]|uniref:Formate dehydrogenase subunit gamma n=2 Tax=Hwanghaeella grinnelliae TaxID=2500179 RepID=A0A437QIN1_9PROT|nr:formate dehydrogenase subunit gamma [Hwanghaeella grinnelliae]